VNGGATELIPASLLPAGISVPTDVGDVRAALEAFTVAVLPHQGQHLLTRVDVKFELPRLRLPALLNRLADSHTLLRAAGHLAASYATIYFDTDDRRLLIDHLRGRRPRHKLRVRHYLDRELSFLEVKTKTAGNRTVKLRRGRAYGGNGLSAEEQRWAAGHTGISQPFTASGWTTCQRLTLLGSTSEARVTVDLNVALGTASGARSLRETALIEVKLARAHGDPGLLRVLRGAGARELNLSKYVAAMMTDSPRLPRARFAAVLDRYARPEQWEDCHA
jgi:hypothetical protein